MTSDLTSRGRPSDSVSPPALPAVFDHDYVAEEPQGPRPPSIHAVCHAQTGPVEEVPPLSTRANSAALPWLPARSRPTFVQQPGRPDAKLVESADHENLFHASASRQIRTCTVKAPGTGSSVTTYRYPPPHPEYIAPWLRSW